MSKCANIFSSYNFLYLINLIRNFYGEVISFYFAWLEYYLQWLFVPSIIGLIVAIIIWIDPFPDTFIRDTTFTPKDIYLLGYCVVILIWASLFLALWKQKEKWYSYIWGTESYVRNEPDSELFEPSDEKPFIFGVKLPFYKALYRNLKKFVSYLVLVIMVAATITIMFLIMWFKKKKLKEENDENYWYNMAVTMVAAVVNALQIKIFNLAFTTIAEIFNKWENYQKDFQRNNDLAVKFVIFDFFNSYSSLFYIGIYKPIVGEACVGTCLNEIGTQLYTTFAINLGLDFVEVGMPFAMFKIREFFYKKSVSDKKNIDVMPHTVTHQMLCDEYTSTIYEYNEMLILFGYVCLFSVTAPLTPLIIFGLIWVEFFVDMTKAFYLLKEDNKILKEDNKKLNDKVNVLESDNKKLSDNSNNLNIRINTLEIQNKGLNDTINILKEDNKELKVEIKEFKFNVKEITNLYIELNKYTFKLHEDYEKILNNNKLLETEKIKLNNEIKELKTKINSLNNQIKKLNPPLIILNKS